jgi:hypothetical protein
LIPISDGLMRKAAQYRSLRTLHEQEVVAKNRALEERDAARTALSAAEEREKTVAADLEATRAEMARRVDEADSKGYNDGYAEAQGKFLQQMEGINAQLAELLQGAFRSGYLQALQAAEVPDGSSLYRDVPSYGESSAAAEAATDPAADVPPPAEETPLPDTERAPDSSVAEDGGQAS